MTLSEVYLSTNEIAKWLGVNRVTITAWLRKKELKGTFKDRIWTIRADFLIPFLHWNPKLLDYYERVRLDAIENEIRNGILYRLSKYDAMVDKYQLAEVFMVNAKTIKKWKDIGYFKSYGENVSGIDIFKVKDIQECVKGNKKLKKRLIENYKVYHNEEALTYLEGR